MKKSTLGLLSALLALTVASPAMALLLPLTYSNVNGFGTYGALQLEQTAVGVVTFSANYNSTFFGVPPGSTSFGVQDVYLNLKPSSYTGILGFEQIGTQNNGFKTWLLQSLTLTKPDGLGYFTLNATSGTTNSSGSRIKINAMNSEDSPVFTTLFTLTATGLTVDDFLAYSKTKAIGGTDTQWMAAMHLAGYDANPAGTDHTSAYLAAPVPIPSAAWLLGSGIIGLIGLKRRVNKREKSVSWQSTALPKGGTG